MTLEQNTVFEEIEKSVSTDEKGRILLGHDFSGKNYRVSKSVNGEVLLTPVVIIPERDMWLYRNPEALRMFQEGLAAAAGDVTEAEDFSQYP